MMNENEELSGCQWLYTPLTSANAPASSVTTLLLSIWLPLSSSLLEHDDNPVNIDAATKAAMKN